MNWIHIYIYTHTSVVFLYDILCQSSWTFRKHLCLPADLAQGIRDETWIRTSGCMVLWPNQSTPAWFLLEVSWSWSLFFTFFIFLASPDLLAPCKLEIHPRSESQSWQSNAQLRPSALLATKTFPFSSMTTAANAPDSFYLLEGGGDSSSSRSRSRNGLSVGRMVFSCVFHQPLV